MESLLTEYFVQFIGLNLTFHYFLAPKSNFVRYLILLLSVAFLLPACSSRGDADDASTDSQSAQAVFTKQTIAPPFQKAKLPAQQQRISADEGGVLSFPSGTEINVPPKAFVYADGQPVTGEVTINLREFRTAAEVIWSGIPMRDWDDETQTYQNFSTAGMFEVHGLDEAQQPVEIAPEHALEVHFVSDVEGTFDFWYFDEEKGDWEPRGENTAEIFTMPDNQAAQNATSPSRPTPPRKFNPNLTQMTFTGMNLADFPELNDPDNIALQYAGKPGEADDPKSNDWIFTTNWYTAELTKAAQAGVYKLYLENDDTEFTTRVRATLLPAAHDAAMVAYRERLASYEAAMQNMEQSRQRMAALRRSMRIDRFGTYNYDVYARWEEPVFAQASFQPEAQTTWSKLDQVYLITDNGAVTVRYPKRDWAMFNFDRNRKNLLVGITSDFAVVMLDPEDFINQSEGLAAGVRQQEWNCQLEGDASLVENVTDMQSLIDRHFDS